MSSSQTANPNFTCWIPFQGVLQLREKPSTKSSGAVHPHGYYIILCISILPIVFQPQNLVFVKEMLESCLLRGILVEKIWSNSPFVLWSYMWVICFIPSHLTILGLNFCISCIPKSSQNSGHFPGIRCTLASVLRNGWEGSNAVGLDSNPRCKAHQKVGWGVCCFVLCQNNVDLFDWQNIQKNTTQMGKMKYVEGCPFGSSKCRKGCRGPLMAQDPFHLHLKHDLKQTGIVGFDLVLLPSNILGLQALGGSILVSIAGCKDDQRCSISHRGMRSRKCFRRACFRKHLSKTSPVQCTSYNVCVHILQKYQFLVL